MIGRMIPQVLKRRLRAAASGAAATSPQTTVGEIGPCNPRAEQRHGDRLNILLPSINRQHYFGGIHTAVVIYRELCNAYPQSRIILTDSAPDDEALSRFADHVHVPSEGTSSAARQIVPFCDRYGKTLPVAPGDRWLATAWWTAYAAQRLADWQSREQGVDRPVAYLIQDFEPGFYPWSSQSALALSTYRPTSDVGIFNTSLLADYFGAQGLGYQRQVVFEPTLHEGLRGSLAAARVDEQPRARRIVVYARPGTPRNAFELLCEGLCTWGWTDPRAREWEVVAPGELTQDVDLGPVTLRSLGKLDVNRYGELLATSAIGVSLMVSPHPSYPPLEMSAMGMGVVTNTYANKDLSLTHPNIRSLDAMTPEAISSALVSQCNEWEARGMRPAHFAGHADPLLREGVIQAIAQEVGQRWI